MFRLSLSPSQDKCNRPPISTPIRRSQDERPLNIQNTYSPKETTCSQSVTTSLSSLSLSLTPRRLSEDLSRSPQELSPLFKRIKKENNNSLLIDSNSSFLKQEFDTELDFNSRQPFFNLFSQLSIEKSQQQHQQQQQQMSPSISGSPLSADSLSKDLQNKLSICQKIDDKSDETITDLSSMANLSVNDMKRKIRKKMKKSKRSKSKSKDTISLKSNVFQTINILNKKKNRKNKRKSKRNEHEKQKHNLFSMKSSVIKELKVSATGGMSTDLCQALLVLRNEGVVRKLNKRKELYKCLCCCGKRFTDRTQAEEHIQTLEHKSAKYEQKLSDIDSLLALDIGKCSDIEVILARKRQLSQINRKTKEMMYSNGIRLKDGFGSNNFVCIQCNGLSLSSVQLVMEHLKTSPHLVSSNESSISIDCTQESNLTNDVKPLKSDISLNLSGNYVQNLLLDNSLKPNVCQTSRLLVNEGIVRKKSRRRKLKYFCLFCETYRSTEKEMLIHIESTSHQNCKSSEKWSKNIQLNSQLCVDSERIDDIEVSLARNKVLLKEFPNDFKIHIINEGIRLVDGIGINAYLCQICGMSLNVDFAGDGRRAVENHLKSDLHELKRKDLVQKNSYTEYKNFLIK
ncbi:uncharacterized protein LOC128953762 [Oppia nitens]|uniref:uncharacterized protein LOC128953762 n=1 Tax=Oppia nitens TaxID=1686743 RepID=UPI0023D99150|nr:uncharacterized protein LOC128953762 [Oppia nitens]